MANSLSNAQIRKLELQHDTVVPAGSKYFPGTETPIPEGITIRSRRGVQIDFMYEGARRTETLRGTPTVAHVLKAYTIRQRVLQAIGLGLLDYATEFPGSRQVRQTRQIADNPEVPTIGEALDTWLVTVKHTVGKNAFIDYTKDIKGQLKKVPLTVLDGTNGKNSLHLEGVLGDLPANQLTPERISNLRSWFLERPVSVKRLMNILIPLRGAMGQLAADPRQQAILEDPFERVRPLKRKKVLVERLPALSAGGSTLQLAIHQVAKFQEDDDRPDPFTPDEVAAFVRCMPEPFVHLVQFWLWTGLRTGELIALQWCDIDWDGGEICVRHSLSRGVFKETKSDRVRWVKLLPPAKAALEAQFAYSGQDASYVFPNPYTKRRWANESKICDRFKAALLSSGVRYRRPYHCRHTYASTLLSAGESTLFVAEQLGHRDWSMVMRHYGRWIPKVDAQAGHRVTTSYVTKWGADGGPSPNLPSATG